MGRERNFKQLTEAEMRSLDALVGKTKRGELVARDVVNAARAKNHPLHGRFMWDRDRAAMAHWLEQARDVIQIYVTIVEPSGKPVHAMVSLPSKRGGYTPVRKVLGNEGAMNELVLVMARELELVLHRYEYLRTRMKTDFEAIEYVVTRIRKCRGKSK